MNIWKHNQKAWNKLVDENSEWSIPVSSQEIEKARNGEWEVILTPLKPVPREWFGDVRGKDILCLASGGGQQAPILAAAGAKVTAFDASQNQLAKGKFVAKRDNLKFRSELGDAADLARFSDGSFDLIFNPCSTCFMAELHPVWNECYRVLRGGGTFLTGFNQPFIYMFDRFAEEKNGVLEIKHKIPYSDLESLSEEEIANIITKNEPLEFSHTLDDQIGGQIKAGFLIAGFYEDWWTDDARLLNKYAPTFAATRGVKQAASLF